MKSLCEDYSEAMRDIDREKLKEEKPNLALEMLDKVICQLNSLK